MKPALAPVTAPVLTWSMRFVDVALAIVRGP
jgi:hypothetical protein